MLVDIRQPRDCSAYQRELLTAFRSGASISSLGGERRYIAPGSLEAVATLTLLHSLSQAFPDAKRDLLIVEPLSDNRVLVYFSFNATLTGQFFGFPSSGNKVSFIGVDIFKIRNHQFIENWHVEDLSRLFEQLKVK